MRQRSIYLKFDIFKEGAKQECDEVLNRILESARSKGISVSLSVDGYEDTNEVVESNGFERPRVIHYRDTNEYTVWEQTIKDVVPHGYYTRNVELGFEDWGMTDYSAMIKAYEFVKRLYGEPVHKGTQLEWEVGQVSIYIITKWVKNESTERFDRHYCPRMI